MNAADPRCAMLSEMTQSAHRLGVAFAAEAERAEEIDRKIEYAKLFDRCFFAVRVGIALDLRLRREGRREAARAGCEGRADPADRAERDPPEDERPERPERFEHERAVRYAEGDRDREVERATLPHLIGALQGVAADAQALPAPPSELLTLRDLLARYSPGNSGPSAPPDPASGPALRARLAGSTASMPGQWASAGVLTRPPDRPPHDTPPPAFRPATGPP